MRAKVTVVGAGNVGATAAQGILAAQLADVVLVDAVEGLPQGKALDLAQTAPIVGYDRAIRGSNNYVDTQGSDIIVITAGSARRPGMSRDDLLRKNAEVVRAVTEESLRLSPDAVVIVVTNPLDAMTQLALRVSGLPRERVVGMAGILDAARFRAFIAAELDVSVDNTHAFVLGGHGDQMVPVARYSTVAGIPLTELLGAEAIRRLIERTRQGGAEVVALLRSGSAYYAPGAAVVEMVDAILNDRKKVLPCAVYLEGEYGLEDVVVGVPVKLGRGGVEQILQVALTDEERAELHRSATDVRGLVGQLGL